MKRLGASYSDDPHVKGFADTPDVLKTAGAPPEWFLAGGVLGWAANSNAWFNKYYNGTVAQANESPDLRRWRAANCPAGSVYTTYAALPSLLHTAFPTPLQRRTLHPAARRTPHPVLHCVGGLQSRQPSRGLVHTRSSKRGAPAFACEAVAAQGVRRGGGWAAVVVGSGWGGGMGGSISRGERPVRCGRTVS